MGKVSRTKPSNGRQFRDMSTGQYMNRDAANAAFFFIENPQFIEELKMDPSLGRALNPVAQAIARLAKTTTPGRRRKDNLRAYVSRVRDFGPKGTQQAALVVSTSPRWHWFEYGVRDQPALHIMGNAARDVVGADNYAEAPEGGDAEFRDTGGPGGVLGNV